MSDAYRLVEYRLIPAPLLPGLMHASAYYQGEAVCSHGIGPTVQQALWGLMEVIRHYHPTDPEIWLLKEIHE